ncbi:trypsin-like serine peptidase [Streptomyces sp. NPDC091272]|uniref:trypsin-like serine peptidase n=1 Tax=Streptomyces sp. NPDC091272 TaxID=3365981 RepID=UPI00380A40D0
MRPIRPACTAPRGRSARRRSAPLLAVVGLTSALALTATACGPTEDGAAGTPTAQATNSAAASGGSADGKITIPDDLKDRLKEHGVDLDKWKNGEWKNWNRDQWLREAQDFINPIIAGLWDPDRMKDAEKPPKQPVANDISGDSGVTDPVPARLPATAVKAPYHSSAAEAGRLLFDGPEGSMACSATVVKDPAHPGRSNLVWTAGHCVHAGAKGGWYRNIAFVPSYNDQALRVTKTTPREQVAPYGVWWAKSALTSDQWIAQGGPTGGDGAPYDFAVLSVTPESGSGKSLEETVGSALPVEFDAPAVPKIANMRATGYPAAPPFDGERMFQCADRPGRLSVKPAQPTMYRIGCTMTGGSSGGGWVAQGQDGKPALVSNTSIGPVTAGWLAGPRLGPEAKALYEEAGRK